MEDMYALPPLSNLAHGMQKLLKILKGGRRFDESGGQFTYDLGDVASPDKNDDGSINMWIFGDEFEGDNYLPELQLTQDMDTVEHLIPGARVFVSCLQHILLYYIQISSVMLQCGDDQCVIKVILSCLLYT
jgi:hypothetical protein